LDFSNKYHDQTFPEQYADKHKASLARRLNDAREQQLLRNCLAFIETPRSVIDIGCGPGRFWPVLAQSGADRLFGLDVSAAMLNYAKHNSPDGNRFLACAGSVTDLPLKDDSFDCVVAMRLLHHFGEADGRQRAISELRRVAASNVVVSLWVDGNYKAWRRRRLEERRPERDYANRHIFNRATLASEFQAAGLSIVRHFDLIPGYSQWRYYVLACQ
jgi:SAM-dependent methyltransferase